MTEQDVYKFYNEKVKIIYSEIEARNNVLPIELLFEIHSAFDHLKRIHVDGESAEEQAGKAYSHLKRGCLDAFKLKLKFFNDDQKKVYGKKADLRIIDNGTFLTDFISERNKIVTCAKEARIMEGQKDVEAAFEKWYNVSTMIDAFEQRFFDSTKIQWAQKQSFFRFGISFVVGVVTGVLASIIVSFII